MTIQNNPANESIRSCIQELIPHMAQDIHEGFMDRLGMYVNRGWQNIKTSVSSGIRDDLASMSRRDADTYKNEILTPLAAKLGVKTSHLTSALDDPTHKDHAWANHQLNNDPESVDKLRIHKAGENTINFLGRFGRISSLTSTIKNPDEQQVHVDANNVKIIRYGAGLTKLTPAKYTQILNDPTHIRHGSVSAAHIIAQGQHPTEQDIRKSNPINSILYSKVLTAKIRNDKIKQRSDITQRVSTAHRFQPASRGIVVPAIDRFLQKNPRALGIYRTAATII